MNTRQISLYVPEAVHRWLRLYAADDGTSISTAAVKALILGCHKLAPAQLKPSDKKEIERYLESLEEMPWEECARKAVEQALELAEWDYKRKQVEFPGEEKVRHGKTVKNHEGLNQHLEEVANEAWYANVPFDSGEAVFEDEADSLVEKVLDEYEEQLKKLGWIK